VHSLHSQLRVDRNRSGLDGSIGYQQGLRRGRLEPGCQPLLLQLRLLGTLTDRTNQLLVPGTLSGLATSIQAMSR
jgi:hypothetical protein